MRCCLFHDWSRWSEPFNVAYSYKIMQSRICNTCGKVQVKAIKQPYNEWFNSDRIINTKSDK